MSGDDDIRRIAEIFRRVTRELYSPGFMRALLYHVKAKSGLELSGLEDIIRLGLGSPRQLYDILAEVLGGALAAELFLATTFREIFRKLDIEFSAEHVLDAFRENDAEGLKLVLDLILAADRSLKYR